MSEIYDTTESMIRSVCSTVAAEVPAMMKNDVKEIILFGSCARGDYDAESDIDIAILMNCDRRDSEKYSKGLSKIAADIDLREFSVVSFLCIPSSEYDERKSWYPLYHNIEAEGVRIYG